MAIRSNQNTQKKDRSLGYLLHNSAFSNPSSTHDKFDLAGMYAVMFLLSMIKIECYGALRKNR